jgi:hypothetical protein
MKKFFFPVNTNEAPSCAECILLADCGGLEGDAFYKGCFQRCDLHCRKHGCDMVCPSVPLLFGEMFDDVGGICVPPKPNLLNLNVEQLPQYIPQVDHGSSRSIPLEEEWIAIPLYSIANRNRSGRYDVRFDSPAALRSKLRLSPAAKIIVTGVTPDRYLEDFWEEHVVEDIPQKLARLGIAAMTVPNFSFMLDVPRSNSLYNLSRIFRAAERISDAGIASVLHLNASTRSDWARWKDVLREQSNCKCIALEFQTGPRRKEIGNRYFTSLVALRDDLGRDIHPVILGGFGRLKQLVDHFNTFTIVDSTPFIKTIKRQVLHTAGGSWKWRKQETAKGEPLNSYLASNIRLHRQRMLERSGYAQLPLRRAA